jgi:hypothetical protein
MLRWLVAVPAWQCVWRALSLVFGIGVGSWEYAFSELKGR